MKRILLRLGWIFVVVAAVMGLNIVNGNLQDSYQDMLIQAGIAITLAVSLNIVNGFTGQFSIGHAGFMAVGAYVGGAVSQPLWTGAKKAIAAAHPGWSDAQVLGSFTSTYWWILPVAMLLGGSVAAIFGWIVGVPSLRLRGDYLAIVTLGFGEIIRVLLNNANKISPKLDYLGGSLGFYGLPKLTSIMFVVVYLTAALVILLTRNLKVSLHGLAYQSIREDEIAADAMGVNTTRVKVAAFMLGAFFAGMAGALYGHGYLFAPTTFNFIFSMNLVVMVVLGGTGSITGAAIAAVVLTAIPELLKNFKDRIPGFKDEYRLIIYALILIVMMIVRPQGVFGRSELSLQRFFKRRKQQDAAEPLQTVEDETRRDAVPKSTGDILRVDGVSKVFGGLTAVNELNIELKPGELVGLIGPNGAGKTTVFNLLTGVYEPTTGVIEFDGRLQAGNRPIPPAKRIALLAMDAALAAFGGWIVGTIVSTSINAKVTWLAILIAVGLSLATAPKRRRFYPGYRPYQFAKRGIARTFQNIRLFPDLSVIQNVILGSYLRRKTNLFDALFRTARMEREDTAVEKRAHTLLQRFDLDQFADKEARGLAYGEQRRLEIARALATHPKLLLLDEPAAGMNPQEKTELMEDILHIRQEFGLTILLIEHDMKVVMGICERIYVLDYGQIIAEGTPEEIRRDPKVIAAYLGEEALA
jgi:branched-chain amino acid transport system permease protein